MSGLELCKTHDRLRCGECRELEGLRADLAIAIEALRKIDDPKKYHHVEPDSYTQAACFQFVAQEALKAIGEPVLPDTHAAAPPSDYRAGEARTLHSTGCHHKSSGGWNCGPGCEASLRCRHLRMTLQNQDGTLDCADCSVKLERKFGEYYAEMLTEKTPKV